MKLSSGIDEVGLGMPHVLLAPKTSHILAHTENECTQLGKQSPKDTAAGIFGRFKTIFRRPFQVKPF